MPGGDGTGPGGMGPMTGRAAGYCAGYSVPGYMNSIGGRGLGFGGGRGWGRGRGFRSGWGRRALPYGAVTPFASYPMPYYGGTATREQELEMLKAQAAGFEQSLGDIRQRISELEAAKEE